MLSSFNEETFEIEINEIKRTITVRDTPGQEDHDRVRQNSFPNTNCYLLCYSAVNKPSLKNIIGKWLPDLQEFYKTLAIPIPFILVATKTDKRDDPTTKKKYHVTTEEGRKMKIEIGADDFIECSAKSGNGIKELLEMAVKASLNGVQEKFHNRYCCILS